MRKIYLRPQREARGRENQGRGLGAPQVDDKLPPSSLFHISCRYLREFYLVSSPFEMLGDHIRIIDLLTSSIDLCGVLTKVPLAERLLANRGIQTRR
jgi:hypothetical protein